MGELFKLFHDEVLGAIVITMENLNCYNQRDIEEMVYECEYGTFAQYTVEQCRKAAHDHDFCKKIDSGDISQSSEGQVFTLEQTDKKKLDKPEFQYVVKRIKFGTKKEVVLGGFQGLDRAKRYVDSIVDDFMFSDYLRGTFIIDSPKGRFVHGCERRENKSKWYEPGEIAYVYDCRKDYVVNLEDVHPKLEKEKGIKRTASHSRQR